MIDEHLLSVQEVTQILNVPLSTVHAWIKEGTLSPSRVGGELCFHPQDIRALFEEQESNSSHRKNRILIIDDDPLVGETLRKLLETNGYEAEIASIGLAAMDLASREPYDLIITDIRMPGMNGLETLKAIREILRLSGKPLLPEIVITAFDDGEVRKKTEELKIRDFILKPFEIGELLTAIEKNLKLGKKKTTYAF